MASPDGNFTFVLIPHNNSRNLVEISRSLKGGLDADELQKTAKLHFEDGRDGEARITALHAAYKEQNKDISSVDPRMMASLATMGVSIEIKTLVVPSEGNGFEGVSMYCDGNGEVKGAPLNCRATSIVQACGHEKLVVRGDAFLGRCYDNEAAGDDWIRRDMIARDADPEAIWVRKCKADNASRNMNAYTSSGTLQNMLRGQGGVPAMAKQGWSDPSVSSTGETDGALTWTQVGEEVEMSILLPTTVTKKQISVKFKPQCIKIGVQGLSCGESGGLKRLLGENGVALFGQIVPDECTWCIAKEEGVPVLQVTLTKMDDVLWPELLQPEA